METHAGVDDPTLDIERDDAEEAATPPASPLDRLRELHREARRERPQLDMNIPGFQGALVARYRVLDYNPELRDLNKRARKMFQADDPDADLKAMIDVIVTACTGIFLRKEETGELVPLEETAVELGDTPVTYNRKLAEAVLDIDELAQLDRESGSGRVRARDVVRAVFPSEVAINNHHTRLEAWMAQASEGADQDF